MSIVATHSDGRSVRQGVLVVEPEGLTFQPYRAPGVEAHHIPAETIRRVSVERRGSRWDMVPRRRVRIELADGVDQWFVVNRPDATVSLIAAVTSDPALHPAVVERRRRDAGGRSPLDFLWFQLLVAATVLTGAAARAVAPGPVVVLDILVLSGTAMVASLMLLEMWRHRRHRLSP